jgi:hypothetical protein
MKQWLVAFLFTQAVEVPIYTVALAPRRWGPRVTIAFGASLLTHPAVWVVVAATRHQGYWKMVAVGELFAVILETAYLHSVRVPSAFRWSLLANASSLGLGVLGRFAIAIGEK